jgi:hypothetical protein
MEIPKGRFRDEVVAKLRKEDWERKGYVLDDWVDYWSCRHNLNGTLLLLRGLETQTKNIGATT